MANPNGSNKHPERKYDGDGNLICVRCAVKIRRNRYCRKCSETRNLWNEKSANYRSKKIGFSKWLKQSEMKKSSGIKYYGNYILIHPKNNLKING